MGVSVDLIKAEAGACSPEARREATKAYGILDKELDKLRSLKKQTKATRTLIHKKEKEKAALAPFIAADAAASGGSSSRVTGVQFKDQVDRKRTQLQEQLGEQFQKESKKEIKKDSKGMGYDQEFIDRAVTKRVEKKIDAELQKWMDKVHPGADMGEAIDVEQKTFAVKMGDGKVHHVVLNVTDIDGNAVPHEELQKQARKGAEDRAIFEDEHIIKTIPGRGRAAPKKESTRKKTTTTTIPFSEREPGIYVGRKFKHKSKRMVEAHVVGENGEVDTHQVTVREEGGDKDLTNRMVREVVRAKIKEAEDIEAEAEEDIRRVRKLSAEDFRGPKKEVSKIASFDDLPHHEDAPVKPHALSLSEYKKVVADFYRNNRTKESINTTAQDKISALRRKLRGKFNEPGADRSRVQGEFRTKTVAIERKRDALLEELSNRLSKDTVRAEHKALVSEAVRRKKDGLEYMYPDAAEEVTRDTLRDHDLPYSKVKTGKDGEPIIGEDGDPVITIVHPKKGRLTSSEKLKEAGIDKDIISGFTKRAGSRVDDPDPDIPTEKKKLVSKDFDKHYSSVVGGAKNPPTEEFDEETWQGLMEREGFQDKAKHQRSGEKKATELRKEFKAIGLKGKALNDAVKEGVENWSAQYFSGGKSRGKTSPEARGIAAIKEWADTTKAQLERRRGEALRDIGISPDRPPERVSEDQKEVLKQMAAAEDRVKEQLAEKLSSLESSTYGSLSKRGRQEVLAYLRKAVNNMFNITGGIPMSGLFLNSSLFKALSLSEDQKIRAFENSFGRSSSGVGPATMNTGQIEAEEEEKEEKKKKVEKGIGLYVSF